ncbi:MAG: hypothetical protein DCC55_28120 [Chloroflexi bacterium]|nr:MAG: hypothetical protein DCC55_28120 [Chloroflexota bacterium]
MNALIFHIQLLEPVLIASVDTGEENSAKSLLYLPGSVLRGLVVQRYLDSGKTITHTVEDPATHLFFDGAVTYLNAYPVDGKGRRMLPRPRSWRVAKDDWANEDIYDFAVKRDPELDSPTSPGSVYCTLDANEATLFSPTLRIGLHNASEERFIKREGDSTVFRYDALAAGERFTGAILCADTNLLENEIAPLFNTGDLQIGRSRSAGYGRVQVRDLDIVADWREYTPSSGQSNERLIVTLLSDAILRDATGQPTTDLGTALGLTLVREHSFIDTGVAGGFNRHWGLPLVQRPTVRAGSVFCVENTVEVRTEVERLVQTGIGERRVEGFGRVALNWQGQRKLRGRLPVPVTLSRPSSTEQTDKAPELMQQMVQRLFRTVLDRRLIENVADPALAIKQPKGDEQLVNSQLSRIRIAVRRAWRSGQRQVFTDFLKNLKPIARNQLTRAMIGTSTVYDWLENGWQNDKLWTDQFTIISGRPRLGTVEARESDALKLEYMARLIDGVCNVAQKRNQQEATQ